MVNRNVALEKINEWIENPNLKKHCLAVEAAMIGYAEKFGVEEKEKWSVAGLIHDADYQKWPKDHPNRILRWLEENGAEEDLINAVASHGVNLGIAPQSQMAKVLRSVDELTGLVIAVALVRPSKSLSEVTLEAVKGKWNKKEFARGVNRKEIEIATKELGIDLDEHIQTVLSALQKISKELEL